MKIIMAFLFLCSACGSSVSGNRNASDSLTALRPSTHSQGIPTENAPSSTDSSRLLGAWTDGSSENATFDIGRDSIFYLESMTSFPYSFKGDSLSIFYPDRRFLGTARFSGDTLFLNDPESGTTMFTRFKD